MARRSTEAGTSDVAAERPDAALAAYPPAPDLLDVMLASPSWIKRRVDRLEFLDLTTVHRTITLTLSPTEIPDGAPTYVPIALFRRQAGRVGVRVVDAAGTVVPHLNHLESDRRVRRMLGDRLDSFGVPFNHDDFDAISDHGAEECERLRGPGAEKGDVLTDLASEKWGCPAAGKLLAKVKCQKDIPADQASWLARCLFDWQTSEVLLVGPVRKAGIPQSWSTLRISYDEELKPWEPPWERRHYAFARFNIKPDCREQRLQRQLRPDISRGGPFAADLNELAPRSWLRKWWSRTASPRWRAEGRRGLMHLIWHVGWEQFTRYEVERHHVEVFVPAELSVVQMRMLLHTPTRSSEQVAAAAERKRADKIAKAEQNRADDQAEATEQASAQQVKAEQDTAEGATAARGSEPAAATEAGPHIAERGERATGNADETRGSPGETNGQSGPPTEVGSPTTKQRAVIVADEVGARAHLAAPTPDPSRIATLAPSFVSLLVVADTAWLWLSGMVVAGLTGIGVIVGGIFVPERLAEQAEATGTLLLVAPTLTATFLSFRAGSDIALELHARLRALLAFVAIFSLLCGVGVVALPPAGGCSIPPCSPGNPGRLEIVWIVLGGVLLFLAALLGRGWHRSAQLRRQIDRRERSSNVDESLGKRLKASGKVPTPPPDRWIENGEGDRVPWGWTDDSPVAAQGRNYRPEDERYWARVFEDGNWADPANKLRDWRANLE